jgi:hypothetical protein
MFRVSLLCRNGDCFCLDPQSRILKQDRKDFWSAIESSWNGIFKNDLSDSFWCQIYHTDQRSLLQKAEFKWWQSLMAGLADTSSRVLLNQAEVAIGYRRIIRSCTGYSWKLRLVCDCAQTQVHPAKYGMLLRLCSLVTQKSHLWDQLSLSYGWIEPLQIKRSRALSWQLTTALTHMQFNQYLSLTA